MNEIAHEKPLVLVIDDDEAIRAYLSAMIEANAETIEAPNGEKGISLAKSRQPDLILLDLMMPGMDGYQVCKTLKANSGTKHIPIVFITAQEDRAFEAAAIKLGALDYIVKPFDTDIVAAKVKNYLSMLSGGEALQSSLSRHRRSKSVLAIAVTIGVLVAGAAGVLGTLFLNDQEDAPRPAVETAPGTPFVNPPATASGTPITAEARRAASSQVSQTVRPTSPAPAAAVSTAAVSSESATEGMVDRKHDRAGSKYRWVKEAHCGVVPLVDWWQNITPASMALYVDRHHDGVWDPYLIKWQKHLIRTENTMVRGGALKAPDGTVLQGAALREFVAKLRKRVDVVECLARAAARRAASAG